MNTVLQYIRTPVVLLMITTSTSLLPLSICSTSLTTWWVLVTAPPSLYAAQQVMGPESLLSLCFTMIRLPLALFMYTLRAVPSLWVWLVIAVGWSWCLGCSMNSSPKIYVQYLLFFHEPRYQAEPYIAPASMLKKGLKASQLPYRCEPFGTLITIQILSWYIFLDRSTYKSPLMA